MSQKTISRCDTWLEFLMQADTGLMMAKRFLLPIERAELLNKNSEVIVNIIERYPEFFDVVRKGMDGISDCEDAINELQIRLDEIADELKS